MADQTEIPDKAHNPCCSSHGVPMTCERYRQTHFCEVRPCCSADAVRLAEEGELPTVPREVPEPPMSSTQILARLDLERATRDAYSEVFEPSHHRVRDHQRALAAAVDAAAPFLTAERDAEITRLRDEVAQLREDHERNRQRLFELGPIIDTLTQGGVAAELEDLRAGAPHLVAAELDRLIEDRSNYTASGDFRPMVLVTRGKELRAASPRGEHRG